MGHHKQLAIELQEGGYSEEKGDEGETFFVKEFSKGRVYVEQDGTIWSVVDTPKWERFHPTLDEAEAAVA